MDLHKREIRGSIPAIIRNDDNLYEGNLIKYFRTCFNHAKNLNNPYHNFRHMCHVMWLCHTACIFYVKTNALSKRQMRTLLIAGLLHDADHTGKPGPDAINIAKAVDCLEKYIDDSDAKYYTDIATLIRISEYPYKFPSEKLSLSGQIIRDADMSQALDPVWIQQVVFGLSAEWGKSPFEVLKMQKKFLKDLKFNTEWAQQMFPISAIESKIKEAEELVNIITSDTLY
jgi:hypothetical protein